MVGPKCRGEACSWTRFVDRGHRSGCQVSGPWGMCAPYAKVSPLAMVWYAGRAMVMVRTSRWVRAVLVTAVAVMLLGPGAEGPGGVRQAGEGPSFTRRNADHEDPPRCRSRLPASRARSHCRTGWRRTRFTDVMPCLRVPRLRARPRTRPDVVLADKTSHADKRQAAAEVWLVEGCGKAIASS